jgi:hypothetical protein
VQITLPPAILVELAELFGTTTRSTVVELALVQLIDRTRGKRRRRDQGEFDAEGKATGTPTHLIPAVTTFSGQEGELPAPTDDGDTPTHPESAVTEIQGQLPEAI